MVYPMLHIQENPVVQKRHIDKDMADHPSRTLILGLEYQNKEYKAVKAINTCPAFCLLKF